MSSVLRLKLLKSFQTKYKNKTKNRHGSPVDNRPSTRAPPSGYLGYPT